MNLQKSIVIFFFALGAFLSACAPAAEQEARAQEPAKQGAEHTTSSEIDGIQVIQFHSEHRCMTCNKIEELSRKSVADFADIDFTLVNVDDAANEEQANAFEAAGTALYLYNSETGVKKDLTDFAFMKAGDENEFMSALRKEIELFKKS